MKKTKLLILIMILPIVVIIFYSCNNNSLDIIKDNFSEIQYNLYSNSNEKVVVEFSSGEREENYVLDAVSTQNQDYGILKCTFLIETEDFVDLPQFVITINDFDYDGELEFNPFDQNYYVDIETFVLDTAEIYVKIMWQETLFDDTLQNISKSFNISYKDAIEIFKNNYQKEINFLIDGNNFLGELYLKIINDNLDFADVFYYYVSMIGKNGQSYSIIIDVDSGQVLSESKSSNGI